MTDFPLSAFEDRPLFEKALRHGITLGLITDEKIHSINTDAPKGMVQIATAFGSPYLRAELELARLRIVNLVSLYLFETADGDLDTAARLIRDHTFLTLSRGGSTLLKELFALPEYAILGRFDNGRVEDFLEFWSRKKNSEEYRHARRQRNLFQLEIRLAKKLGAQLGLTDQIFQDQHCEADALIRTAILLRTTTPKNKPVPPCFDQIGFAALLDRLRKKLPAKLLAPDGEFSDAEQALIAQLSREMQQHDFAKIADSAIPLSNLINQIKARYFIRDTDMEDTAGYEALVSKEWSKYTKGKTDIDAIFTMLLCLAANLPGKTSLAETAAKTLIKKIRKDGFHPELAREFITLHAPHEKQESLLADWQDFCEQAELYLADDWDHDLHIALKFLRDNCYIEKPVKKAAK